MRLILDTRRAMFSTLRIVAIIGAIFYLSPVRQPGTDAGAVAGDTLAWAFSFLPKAAPAEPKPPSKPAAPSVDPGALEALWRNLPEAAKKAMLDQLIAGARQAAAPAPLPDPTDTLQPEDLQPAWKGDGRKKG
ncbi:MAG TPA: hypothetical protein VIL09_11590 [Microvirga sp.]